MHKDTAEAVAAGWNIEGNPNVWNLVCKASNKELGIFKSTKRMGVPGGAIYQVTTQTPQGVAEALVYVPGDEAE